MQQKPVPRTRRTHFKTPDVFVNEVKEECFFDFNVINMNCDQNTTSFKAPAHQAMSSKNIYQQRESPLAVYRDTCKWRMLTDENIDCKQPMSRFEQSDWAPSRYRGLYDGIKPQGVLVKRRRRVSPQSEFIIPSDSKIDESHSRLNGLN